MTTENQNSNQKQPQTAPNLDDFASYIAYQIECKRAGVTPVPNPRAHIPADTTGKASSAPVPVKHLGSAEEQSQAQESSVTPTRSIGFDPHTVEPFDGWTAEQIKTVATYHWDYLPLFSKEKTSWWAENTKGVDFFKRNFHKMAEAFPINKLTLERMEYAIKKATEPLMEWDYDPNCPYDGCQRGLIKEMQKVGKGHLPVIVRECECRRLAPVGTAMRKKQL